MIAARHGKTEAVVELIREGADIDMQNIVCCLLLRLLNIYYCPTTSGSDHSLRKCGTEAVACRIMYVMCCV